LSGVALTLRRGLWLFVATILVCVAVAAVALKLGAPTYTATMVVAPAEYDPGAASRLAAQIEEYAQFATFAQLPLKFEGVPAIERYLEILASPLVAQRLEAEHQVLQRLFADQWDAERQAWRPPSGLVPRIEGAVSRFFGYPAWKPPGPEDLAGYFGRTLEVRRPIATSALRRIELSRSDGAFAAHLLALLHETADDVLRQEARRRVAQQITHLEDALGATDDPPRREALNGLLGQVYQQQAMLASDLPFAVELVSPPAASATPTSLSPLLILALAAVVGAIVGMLLVFLRDALRSATP
jgi:Chain length determinant protein